jgi:hypothetical protein
MGKKKTFEILCPCCQAKLTVDGELGAVLSHEVQKQQKVTDLGEAARELRERESHRDEQFERSVRAERDRSKLLEAKFDEAFRKVKDEPDSPRPVRDIDLD